LTPERRRHNIQTGMIIPIFPLPDVVLFPRTLLPLRIFERRYREMTREAIEGDRRIAIVLLREGWEASYFKNPPVHRIACIGEIEHYEELEGGKYSIVLAGTQRVRLVREIEHSPYRMAEVEPLDEASVDELQDGVVRRRNQLSGLFSRFTELVTGGKYRTVELVPQLDFEALVNMVATTLSLPVEEKQALLEIDDVGGRCDVLLPVMQRQLEALILVRDFEHIKPEDPRRN
jgi:uncharacterized protein